MSELAGRYKTISPYVQDSYKITPKLTLDLGLRWDYLPPFHELRNRWTFLNPTMTNPLTNTPGILQFAGNYGGCRRELRLHHSGADLLEELGTACRHGLFNQ